MRKTGYYDSGGLTRRENDLNRVSKRLMKGQLAASREIGRALIRRLDKIKMDAWSEKSTSGCKGCLLLETKIDGR